MKQSRIEVSTLVITCLAGILWTAAGEFVLRLPIARFLQVGLYLAGLGLSIIIACLLSSTIHRYPAPLGKDHLWTVLILCLVLAGGSLLDYVYNLNFQLRTSGPTSYIFLVDDSSSMQNNDPDGRRVSAIKDVLNPKKADFPFCVYFFSDHFERNTGMEKTRDAEAVLRDTEDALEYYGMTYIPGALQFVAEDLRNGVIDGGRAPLVILLTDGANNGEGSLREAVEELRSRGCTVSAVGFGDAEDAYLEDLAAMGGGSYVQAENALELGSAYQQAVSGGSRSLLTPRGTSDRHSPLYAIVSAVLLLLANAAVIQFKMLQLNVPNTIVPNRVFSDRLYVAGAILAALLAELLLNWFSLPPVLVRLVCNLLLAAALIPNRALWPGMSGANANAKIEKTAF